MRIAELFVTTALMWTPPPTEGPEPLAPDAEGPASIEQNPYALPDDEPTPPAGPDISEIVEDAAAAAKDRAYLQRTNREIEEYVHQLDELASVDSELDTCARAIQAELRMALALAYLEADGTCLEAQDDSSDDVETRETPLPVLECAEATNANECADRLLEQVAAFASLGPAGPPAPFSQAFGCPHAAAQMSVEQMFGACLSGEYDEAITRFEASLGGEAAQLEDEDRQPLPVPRWASIAGISGGAALVITGGVLLGINGTCPGGYDPVTEVDQCPSVYNTDVSGGVLVGVGAVAVLGMGAVLTITELQRAKQGKTRQSALRRRIDRAQALTGLRLSFPRTGN